MYVYPNYPTKKALKDAVAAGKHVSVFAPGLGVVIADGHEFVEGPHAPKPHTWYAKVLLKNRVIVKVID